jgi:hypothetical protein
MKTVALILSIIGLTTLSSCNQNTDTKSLLENTETRNEIISTIASNHNYMMEFMGAMQENDHAMQMMQGDHNMMGSMLKGNGMQMMMKDSMMMGNMMQGMMKDGKMMGSMVQMMHEKGMMSEDCMQSCMKMMGEKGMNNMDDMDSPTKEDHSEHH